MRFSGNIVQAIQVSNDTFFWKLASQLGWRPLAQWARAYGLGESTGIDLPGEETKLASVSKSAGPVGSRPSLPVRLGHVLA